MSPIRTHLLLLLVICWLGYCKKQTLDSKNKLIDTAPYQVEQARIPAPEKGPGFKKNRYLLLISIDGIAYQAIQRYLRYAPNLRRLARRGFLRPMQTVFPSVTWPAHMSMLTGQYPRRHGIIGNRWLKDAKLVQPYLQYRKRRKYKRVPTIFNLIKNKKIYTAALNWPYSQRLSNVDFNLPEMMYSGDYLYAQTSSRMRKVLKSFFSEKYDWHSEEVDFDLEGYLKTFLGKISRSEEIETDTLVKDLVVELIKHPPRGQRPRATLVHFLTADSWLHRYGFMPWVTRTALKRVDEMVGDLLKAYEKAGILKRTVVFVVSDHGFLNVTHSIDLKKIIKKRPDKLKSKYVYNGHSAFVYLHEDEDQSDLAVLIEKIKDKQYKQCIEATYLPDSYAKLGLPDTTLGKVKVERHSGAPNLVVMTKPHCRFRHHRHKRARAIESINRENKHWLNGAHGYLPSHKNMFAFMIGAGPGIKRMGKRRINKADIVDLAPTMTHLLGLSWPKRWPGFKDEKFTIDGKILKDVVR